MSGQHSQATTFRHQIRKVTHFLEEASHAAAELPIGYDSEIQIFQKNLRKEITRAQRMCRLANAMVEEEEKFLAREKAEKGG